MILYRVVSAFYFLFLKKGDGTNSPQRFAFMAKSSDLYKTAP